MKIALVVPGGVDRSETVRVIPALLALMRQLTQAHELHVFALRQERDPGEWPLAGARVHNVGWRRTRWRAIAALWREHRRRPFAVVHAVWAGNPAIVAVAAAHLLRIPSVVHLTGGEIVAMPDIDYGGRLRLSRRLADSLTLRSASAVTATSAPLVARLAQLGIRARRIPLGVDTQVWPVRPPRARDLAAPARLIHVGSLNRVKDQPALLRALATLLAAGRRVRLDIVGEDTLSGTVQSLARELGVETHVEFHGFLPQSLLRPLLESAHLLVMSSRHEAGPYVLLEAAIAGIPTVGTAVGHAAEFAPTAALAVGVSEPAALAAAIALLLDDEPRRLSLAAAAQQRALAEDAGYTARCFEALYRELNPRRN